MCVWRTNSHELNKCLPPLCMHHSPQQEQQLPQTKAGPCSLSAALALMRGSCGQILVYSVYRTTMDSHVNGNVKRSHKSNLNCAGHSGERYLGHMFCRFISLEYEIGLKLEPDFRRQHRRCVPSAHMHVNSNKGTDHSKPAERLGKWTHTCKTWGWACPVGFVFGVLIYSPYRWLLGVCLQNSDSGTISSLYGCSFYLPTLDTPHTNPYILQWAYIHKSLVQTFKLQGFQTTTITLSSQPVQINYCRLQSWAFVKFKQIRRAPELCSIALLWQPAPSSSPRQSNPLMGFFAHQLPSHQLRRCRSSRSLIQTRVFVLQLWNKEVLLTPNLASILSHFHK